jgi:5-methylcytosine-specific restriction endonuclease McrA
MSAQITSFIAERITITKNGSIANKDLLEAYLTYANTTTGRNSLYKQIEDIEGVSRSKTHFKGISFRTIALQTIEVAQPKRESELSAYEQKCIELKERKLTQQKELEAIRLAAEKELQQSLKAQDIAVAEKDIAVKIELKMIDVAEKAKDREFMREENNKNRRMHMSLRHNKYLDFAVYGTPASQYIERSSMVNVLGFSAYDALTEYNPELLKAIDVEATTVSKCIPVYENASTKQIDVISVSDAMKVVETISKQADAPRLLDLIGDLEKIQHTAVSDDCRAILSRYMNKKSAQNKSVHGSSKHKLKYVKAVNKLHEQDGKVLIQCTCCHSKIDLQSSGCHRAHDIPQSDGGDWSTDNVYLTCASCNATMSDQLSVLEYKVELYVKVIEQD